MGKIAKLRCNGLEKLIVCMLFILIAGPAFAQKRSRFAESPAERSAFAEQLATQAGDRRAEAEAWAKTNNAPLRIDNGRQLRELVAIRNGKPLYIKTLNNNAAISTAANLVRQTAPYNLDGAGIVVGIWDGGSVLTTHQEFGGRIVNKNSVASHYHATHVGGTIAASGTVAYAKGMAPSVLVDSYDWNSDYSEMTAIAASAPGEASNIYLSNHSYGYGSGWEWNESSWDFYGFEMFGQYNTYARDLDKLVSDAQYYLPFWAAGNDRGDTGDGSSAGDNTYKGGYDTISYSSIAKNVMTVGAVNDAVSGGVRSLANATMAYFSSWGPADDGRIKPDIVANGVGLYSTYDTSDSSYATLQGTSMATPNACGSAALLVEYYKNQTGGGAMRASTLKGLIIHTADDLGNPGPDYSYGWGLMNTLAGAALIKDYSDGNTNRIVESELSSTSMSRSYTVFSSGASALRITLCWTDQPGLSDGTADDNRSPDLVNDLDLKITDPNGAVHYPYKLDYSNPTALATTNSSNTVDNVEQVYITSPIAGNYTITVNCDESLRYYTNILTRTGRNYVSTPTLASGGTQSYSLLVSGLASDTDGDALPNDWEALYFGSETNAVASADPDGDGTDNLTEYVAGTDPTNPDSVFEATSFTPPASNGAPVVITWDSVAGRIYNVGWSDSLTAPAFTNNYSIGLPYPINSYTDTVERTGGESFYRVDVRLNQ